MMDSRRAGSRTVSPCTYDKWRVTGPVSTPQSDARAPGSTVYNLTTRLSVAIVSRLQLPGPVHGATRATLVCGQRCTRFLFDISSV